MPQNRAGSQGCCWVCWPYSGPLLASSDHDCPLVPALRQAGLATSYALWAASESFAAFLASRVIGGISKGNVSLSTAIVADLGSPPARSRGMVSAHAAGEGPRLRDWVSLLAQAASSPGSHRGGLLAGLHAGSHAGRLPARGHGALAGPALRSLRPAVPLLLPAGDAAPREAGRWDPEPNGLGAWVHRPVGLPILCARPRCQGRWGCPLLLSLKAQQVDGRPGWLGPCRVQALSRLGSCLSPGCRGLTPSPQQASPVLPPPGTLRHPGVPSCRRPAQPPGPAPLLRCGPWPGPTLWRQ